MPSRDPRIWMWAEALDMMDKAERMHRQFFQPAATPAQGRRPTWQPPVDLIETADEYLVVVALPGVRPDQVQVVIDGGVLIVVGERALPVGDKTGLIHRMEIPTAGSNGRSSCRPARSNSAGASLPTDALCWPCAR